jgi:hypothetical protein
MSPDLWTVTSEKWTVTPENWTVTSEKWTVTPNRLDPHAEAVDVPRHQ